ncbi:nuclear receptor coactivator 7-like [Nothobranchius furzeri]|uniref:Nuclear receptor coactivator 7-like n=1 Tax=Nothobranchius furzeri TaxID=105023 RepID=A0A9D3C2D8_NOTFU|nr:nuclear receptor coactivator 7-like [Nothobranchius furzeri]
MEKRERKQGYFDRLKKRKQLRSSQSEKSPNDRSLALISDDPIRKAEPQRVKPSAGLGDGCKSNKQTKMERKKPPGTVEFIVGPDDSLNSIALKFNVTPNKLVQLNKLFSRSVYPGQKLFVPDLSQSEADLKSPTSSDPSLTNIVPDKHDCTQSCRSAKSIRRELSPNSEDESPATVKFIKMSCKYFTDGMGVVGGVLIVTPNNIMFDPHKSDPLVIENGCEEYGLICPMNEVVSVALYDDLSRMKLKDTLPSKVFFPSVTPEGKQAEKSPSDEGFTELEPNVNRRTEEAEGAPSTTLGADRYELAVPSCPSWGKLPDNSMIGQAKRRLDDDEDEGVAQNSSIVDGESMQSSSETKLKAVKAAGPQVTETKDVKTEGPEELLSCVGDKIIRKLSLQEDLGDCGTSGLGGQNPGRPANGGKAGEERLKKNYESEMKSWLLKRMQAPIEDMLLSSKEKSKNPPMFLCFKVGKPMRKSFAISMTSSPAPWFRGQETQPEYWFAVPQERVHDLYSFFVQWSPDVYGKEAREQGFVVVEKDELDMIDNFFSDPSSCSWEIITINEAKRRQSFGSCDKDTSVDALPFLIDSSDVLQDFHIEKLASRLPARVEGYPWRLAYSTEKHGTSLKTLYRNLAYVDNPVLLVIKNMDDQIFGAFSTHPFRVSEHFYGTGETFLFSFCPELEVYRWTGENSYFVKGNTDSLQMGGGGGHLGLWLDGELYRGTTTKCSTFDNKPLSLQPDFNIRSLEVWTFE